MSTVRQRILDYLQKHTDGADDDQLSLELQLHSRQQANQVCRQLEAEGMVRRISLRGQKIRNYWHGASVEEQVTTSEQAVTEDPDEAWFWEGNVQARIVDHLRSTGWTIDHVCDIQAMQHGVDILASRNGSELAVEVKGYPSTVYQRGPEKGQPKPTRPRLQAKHWFANALLTAILRQTEMTDAQVALGFPHTDLYVELLKKTEPSLTKLNIAFFMVHEDGSVWRFPPDR